VKTIASEVRVRGLDAPTTLGALHTLLGELLHLTEGQYLLRVEPKGAALLIYGPPSAGQSHALDLDQEYAKSSSLKLAESVIGGHVDSEIVTPWCLQNQRVPATFAPRPQDHKYNP